MPDMRHGFKQSVIDDTFGHHAVARHYMLRQIRRLSVRPSYSGVV